MTVSSVMTQTLDKRDLRNCLGHFTTGVTVVTYRRGNELRGATVNSFTSVSMGPPLVLVALDRGSKAVQHLGNGPYVINLLAEHQRDIAMHFAGRPATDQLPWLDQHTDFPRLEGTIGHVVCRPWRSYDGGDHVLFVGEVVGFEQPGGRPLLFFRGKFPRLA
jgi:flavin reductase (DIM6/NTAB) family NADH-FMN oxidoreductase RutF